MITPDDLLDFAAFDLASVKSETAARRAISASYYAAFHAIAWAGAELFNGSPQTRQRIARSYDHGAVRSLALEMDRQAKQPGATTHLAVVSRILLHLREMREIADYDLLSNLGWTESLDCISQAAELLRCLALLKADPVFAELILLPLLRDRSRRG